MAAPNPMEALPKPPTVSKRAILMAGILVDVYGLDELPSSPAAKVSCLWLHHGRTRSKADMGEFAARAVAAWAARESGTPARGLIAAAFDQRNHGTRLVDTKANSSWRDGNVNHALDMFASVTGMVSDTSGLMDVVSGYLGREVDQHLVLGVSLGGHAAWQTLFRDERVKAGVVIVGCPDFMSLMKDRARKSKLKTFRAEDAGATFLGSKDFPPSLVEACLKHDPKGILFGTGDIVESPSREEQLRLRTLLDSRIRGKEFLLCSGAVDKLVPYSFTKPFATFLGKAVTDWYRDGDVYFENKVYQGIGHVFTVEMGKDAIRFLLDRVADAGDDTGNRPDSSSSRSRI